MVSLSEKEIPHSDHAEQHLLSSIFIDGIGSLNKCLTAGLTVKSFYDTRNATIFQEVMELNLGGKPISLDVVVESLQQKRKIGDAGGLDYLVSVSGRAPTTAELPVFIDSVKDCYLRRALIAHAANTSQTAYQETVDLEKYAMEISSLLSTNYATKKNKSLASVTDLAIEVALRFYEKRPMQEDLGLSWPWPDFNERFGEMMPGQVIVIAARPGGGKSSLLRQVADHVSKLFGNFLLFSREMMVEQMPFLFSQMRCGHSWKDFRKGRLAQADMDEFIWSLRDFKKNRQLHIFDGDKSITQILARSKSFSQLSSLKGVGVDYLQRYHIDQAKGETRDAAIGRATGELKDLAVDLKVPLLLLCQVNRSAEKEGRPLNMADLRECFCEETSWIYTPQGVFRNTPLPLQVSSLTGLGEIIEASSRHAPREKGDTVRVELGQGKTLICTPKHPIMTDKGWVAAGELTTENVVACAAIIPAPKNTDPIPGAKWIGRMIGNGSYVRGTPSFIASCSEVARDFCEETRALFGFTPKAKIQPRPNVQEFYLSTSTVRTSQPNPFTDWLKRMGMWGKSAEKKSIPSWFCETANNESIALLLGGLFETDGSFHGRKASYSTTSPLLIEQVIWALLRLGITARREPPRLSPKANFPIHRITITDPLEMDKFRSLIPIIGRKGETLRSMKLSSKNNNYGERLPVWVGHEIKKVGEALNIHWSELGYRPQNKKISRSDLTRVLIALAKSGIQLSALNALLAPDVRWTRVKSITPAGVRPLFDRVVPEHHTLVMNGVCAHNSGNIEQDADRIIFLEVPSHDPLTNVSQNPLDGSMLYVTARQVKGRDDGRGECGLYFQPRTTTFRSAILPTQPRM